MGLFALRYVIAVAEATIVDGPYQLTRELLSVASAMVFVVAAWTAARPWAKIAGCIAFLVLTQTKYKMLESATGVKSVVSATEVLRRRATRD